MCKRKIMLAIAITVAAGPKLFIAADNNTDHLHPNNAGYKTLADAVDLKIFAAKK